MFVAEYNHGLNRVPLCQALVHPEPQNVTLSGNRLFTDVINVGSSWTRVGQEHMGGPQKLKKARKDPPWNLQKTCSPDNTSVFTLSHYNCERINFCCFRPPRVWAIVRAIIEINRSAFNHVFNHGNSWHLLRTCYVAGSVPKSLIMLTSPNTHDSPMLVL